MNIHIRDGNEEESKLVLFMDGRAMSYSVYEGKSSNICDMQPQPEKCHGTIFMNWVMQ